MRRRTPFGVGDGLDESVLGIVGGRVAFEVAVEMLLIGESVVDREEDGMTGEAGFDGVERGFGLTFGAGGAGRVLGVGAVRLCACGGGIHADSFL